ncbi:tetratricopeptide repeat protein [Aliifodinibius sp. S!AR15-10]|uniref:tetratricopeptide repeat protein n=1 Tax=Aliifodinibius sp. S!AR15-10 TaxID=2950437 RepID=UPI00285E9679|nr:tetratricopeptide repeat protein [Aliifodinibius sp. S!AR15-10]MDR8392151.1 tetratricopeptide repeat protein [Aliifodinibius sp. S!AR15-10]
MFKKLSTLSLLTLLIGILVAGCSSSNPYVDDAKSQMQDGNYQAALEAAQQSIKNQPNDPLGYYYQGVIYGDMAQEEENPAARQETYKKMNESFEQARELASKMEDPPSELENLGAVKTTIWSNEHNRAIELATSDSLRKALDNPIELAAEHLQNATLIMPDSVLSWDVLSEIQIMNNNTKAAIQAKEKVLDLKQQPSAQDYNRLADFYRAENNFKGAINVLSKGREAYPDSVFLSEKLADSYQSDGQYQKAISTVERLIERDPDNPQYHLALGTQLYQTVLELNDSLSTNSDQIFKLNKKLEAGSGNTSSIKQQISELQSANKSLQSQISDLTDRAIEELNTVIEYRPDDASAYNTLGVIYQNKASALFEEREQTMDNQKAAEIDKQAREHLQDARKYYEKATEIDPDNKQYWESLFRVYVALGMDERAKEAQQKAGM